MANPTARFLVTNLVQASATTRSASSSATGFPVANLTDPLRSKTWRSATGWTIVTGWNDRIDFNRGGVLVATIAAGTYATGAAMCTAIVTALEAADATPVWACAYTANAFVISTAAHTFTLLFLTGTNAAAGRSIHQDLGFTSTDKTPAALTWTAEAASYQSRHYVGVDLGSAIASTVGVVLNHNAGASGTFTMKGNATSIALALTTPTVTKALVGDANIRLLYYSTESYRYWVLEINNTTDTDGYTELGIWFLGTYTQLAQASYAMDEGADLDEYSSIMLSDTGSHFTDDKPQARRWELSWTTINEADRVLLQGIATTCPKGKPFIFSLDAAVTPTSTYYVYRPGGQPQTRVPVIYWTMPTTLCEALG
jgi:hypothetical protein